MTDLAKLDLFRQLGYGGEFDLLEAALKEAGLSRPSKARIATGKAAAVEQELSRRFLRVCNRGDCRAEASEVDDGRSTVPAATPGDCSFCGGSANARAVDDMVAAWKAAGMSKLCVVGGSPNAREEFRHLVGDRIELRLIDGLVSRTRREAEGDLEWADRVVVWGSTLLTHSVSHVYQGVHVIQMARRSIQELPRETTLSASLSGGAERS